MVDLDADGMLTVNYVRAKIKSIHVCGWRVCASGSGEGPVAETGSKVMKLRTTEVWYSGEFLDV